jgi:crotonobetainyl-CoA:carnitine CoA-transferase CaiB-like acyl-CoA transferase
MINSGNTQIFQRLLTQVVDLPHLATDPAYATNRDRLARRDEIFSILQRVFERQPWSHWQERMRKANVPCGVVRTVGEAIRSAEVREREIVTRIPHPELGWVPNVSLPIRYSGTPLADPVPAPRIGEHTEAVLADWLGHDSERLRGLARSGAFGKLAADQRVG